MSVRTTDHRRDQGPVFIIGGSRTGSEMLKTMLRESPEQDFVDELFLLYPRWLHPDLASKIRRHVGDLTAAGALDRLLSFLYSGEPYGWFWEHAEEQLDRQLLRKHLREGPLSLHRLFDAIMRTHAEMRGKTRLGAKFPVDFSYIDRLLRWYPDCQLLHTVREPKAVYASQAAKHTSADQAFLARGSMRFRQFVHINLQVAWAGRVHRRFAGHENYLLVRYEDTVGDPEHSLKRICAFLGLEFRDEMLNPKRYGSSFGKVRGARGVDTASLERWRRELSPVTARLIDGMHPLARRRLGYSGLEARSRTS